MGFLDKAKKLAEQAQTKLDEAQKQFNESQSPSTAPPPGPAVEYDKHGRPIASEEPASATPPHGDPIADPPAAPPAPGAAAPVPDPAAPAAPASPTQSGEEEDRNHPSYAPPKLSSGDPLAP
jgi:hypothetical protein